MLFQVAVALVKSMKLQHGRDEAEQAAAFAKAIHQKWGVGASTCDNGLVLFLSKNDRQVCSLTVPRFVPLQLYPFQPI